jgi:fibronectin-binding autotransporter adhesin
VRADPGSYVAGTTYTILTASGGVSGAFAGFTGAVPSIFLTPTLSYDADDVFLSLVQNGTSFASVATTPNQRAVANAAENLGAGNAIYDSIASSPDAGSAQQAFGSLSGEVQADIAGALLNGQQQMANLVLGRLYQAQASLPIGSTGGGQPVVASLSPAPAGDSMSAMPVSLALADPEGRADRVADPAAPVVGMQSIGDWGQLDGNGNAALFNYSTYGVMIGADRMFGERWRAGAALAYSRSYFGRGEPFDDQGTANNYTAALYGGRTFGNWALRLGASYGRHDVGTTRQVAFTGFADSDRANYTAQTAQGFGEIGYDLKLDTVAVEPFANFAYTSEQAPGFT